MSLDSAHKCINEETQNKKKLLRLEDFNSWGQLLTLRLLFVLAVLVKIIFHSHNFHVKKAVNTNFGLDSANKCINKVAKNIKKLLRLEDFNWYFKLLALKHTSQKLINTTMKNTHDDYKSLNNKIAIK